MFWLKYQPYSIYDMFMVYQNDKIELAKRFVGGTVYQAYLSVYNYHRWHAPISGVI